MEGAAAARGFHVFQNDAAIPTDAFSNPNAATFTHGAKEPLIPQPTAQVLYEKYCASSGGLNFRGEPCPVWGELPSAIQSHWAAVAYHVNYPSAP